MKRDFLAVKTRMQSQVVLIPVYDYPELEKIKDGTSLNVEVSEVIEKRRRSVEQLNLYWASCHAVASATEDEEWNTKDKVDEQTKIALRFVDYWIYYQNQKTGEMTLNIKTKSISFENLAHLDACAYFDDAFKMHARKIGMDTVEEWIEYVQFTMTGGKR